jgi:hypothetical protein
MPLSALELRLQAAVRRHGLKLITDPQRTPASGEAYFLRPISDASQALRQLPCGGVDLVRVWGGRRRAASVLQLEDIERLLANGALAGLPVKRGNRWK